MKVTPGGIDATAFANLGEAETFSAKVTFGSEVEIDGAFNHDGTTFGVYGVTPATRPAAYTQAYATATRTHEAPTATSVATTGATAVTPFGFTTAAQPNAMVAAINALIVDVANIKQVLNSVIDDDQAQGLKQ